MSPRPYDLGRRQADIDEGRRRILDAARALLAESRSFTAFTVDAVAKRADVARATVYYQFSSKTGLLEALCDDLAASGQMERLADAFAAPDPARGLELLVAAFARFWDADRPAMRRLRALAALDPGVASVIAARDQRRHQAISALLERLGGLPAGEAERARLARLLYALTSFETFDTLAGERASIVDVAPQIEALAASALAAAVPVVRSDEVVDVDRDPPST
jgi:AcrR family transcriptional regulator